ncbi:MAG: dockerin type I repeat-containing protein [Bacteroidales bacterium]|nr:dockerin type I repeat-containing protein [Bacteroidales bacterium]
MKKGLLLLAAVSLWVATSAQTKALATYQSRAIEGKMAPMSALAVKAKMAAPHQRKISTKSDSTVVFKAWYNRPAGSMYCSISSAGGAMYSPTLMLPCWRELSWTNATTGADSHTWEYERYNMGINKWETTTSTDENLTTVFGPSTMMAPKITAVNASGKTDTYQLYANIIMDFMTMDPVPFMGSTIFSADPRAYWAEINDVYFSPKFWSAGAREQNPSFAGAGFLSFLGAEPAEGEDDGQWFGKNSSGWNAMALYVEKPAYAYALRGLHVYYECSSVYGETPVYAKIYAVTKDSTDNLVFGEELYSAKGVLSADAPTRGFIDMPLYAAADTVGNEVVASIDQEIAVVTYGYENAAASGFTMCVSGDCVDEGYGQHGYMVQMDSIGNPSLCIGLDQFFTLKLGCSAPSVFLDIEWPMMQWNHSFETGAYSFPAAGGKLVETADDQTYDYISVFSSKRSQQWTVLTADAQEVPEWLSLKLTDVLDESGEFANEVRVEATAAALPAGVKYRECDVKFAVPAAAVVYHFTQGEKPSVLVGDIDEDGDVNVTDVTCLINKVLGNAVYSDQVCDIDGNGAVDVSDVTALINMILS